MYALKVVGLSLDLFGHPVIAHLDRFRSMYDHCANLYSLLICDCMCCILSVIIARSSAYAVVVQVKIDVLKWCPRPHEERF